MALKCPEFVDLTKKYNSDTMKIIRCLKNFNGNNPVLNRLDGLSKEFIRSLPNDLLLLGGRLMFNYKDDINNNNVQTLLDEDYSKHIFDSVDGKGRKFIIDIISIIKSSWIGMNESEKEEIAGLIKSLLGYYLEYLVLAYQNGMVVI